MNITFLMPCRIESEDRLKNVVTSVSYLLTHFPESKIILKENDQESIFKKSALPLIYKSVEKLTDNIVHIFDQTSEKFFHKTKILNDLLLESDTEIVYNYDVDVIYPVSSYLKSFDMITKDGYDAIYTYGCGVYQWSVDYPSELFDNFMSSKFDISLLNQNCTLQPSVMGWGQMIKREVAINSYMWNENFMAWGPEDSEYLYRLQVLNYKVGRVKDYVYHFEHSRTFNSHYHNPKWQENYNLWSTMRNWDKERIINYYEQQSYVKLRRQQLNVSV